MNDPLTLGLASTAVGLVNGTISLFKQVNESAKNSDNLDLKNGLSSLGSQIVDLKVQILDLAQENADLRKQLDRRENVRWDSTLQVYFLEGDQAPICPSCWDLNGKLIRLHGERGHGCAEPWRYECKVCKNCFMVPD
jgi:hypothetical protein